MSSETRGLSRLRQIGQLDWEIWQKIMKGQSEIRNPKGKPSGCERDKIGSRVNYKQNEKEKEKIIEQFTVRNMSYHTDVD